MWKSQATHLIDNISMFSAYLFAGEINIFTIKVASFNDVNFFPSLRSSQLNIAFSFFNMSTHLMYFVK